jgi:hypothetical protein
VGQRTHDYTPLLPSPRLARLILADLLDGVCKADRVGLGLVIGLAFGSEAHFLKRLLAAPDRLQQPFKFLC